MIQRLWLLPMQEDQMVVLFDMRGGGGVVLGTGLVALMRALNTLVHTVVNFWMDCSLPGCHCHSVSASSHLRIFIFFSATNVKTGYLRLDTTGQHLGKS